MTNQEILEGTKLIAKFMGYTKDLYDHGKNGKRIIWRNNLHSKGHYKLITEFKYHCDWDELMEVVDKIESLKGDNAFKDNPKVKLQGDHVEIFWWALYRGDLIFWKNYSGIDGKTYPHKNQEESRILALFRAIVEFLKWYNKNKSKSI